MKVRDTLCLFIFGIVSALDQVAEITISPKSQQVKAGGTVSFYCDARGDPQPQIQWRKNGKQITSSHPRYLVQSYTGGAFLRIEPVRDVRDDAVYECVAENGVSNAVSAEAPLTVHEPDNLPSGFPMITETPTTKVVEIGHTAVLSCAAVGSPKPIISWLRDMMPIDTSNPRYMVLESGTLQITGSQVADQGKYECVASNSVGTEYSKSTTLYVKVRRVAPQFSIRPPPVNDVLLGTSLNITCVAFGAPMPFVKWRKDPATDMTTEDKLPIGINVLSLTNIQESTNYTCIAASDLGVIEAGTMVKVQFEPRDAPLSLRASDVSAHSMTLRWTAPVTLNSSNYTISFDAIKEFVDSRGITQTQVVQRRQIVVDPQTTTTIVDGLAPFTTYNVSVTAVSPDGRYISPAKIIVTTEMAAPEPMVKPDFYGVVNEEEIQVILPQASEEYGPISHYYLIVAPEDEATDDKQPDELTEDMISPVGGKQEGENSPYIAAKFLRRNIPFTFHLGSGGNYGGFVDKKLHRNRRYRIFVRAIVDSQRKYLYTSSPFSEYFALDMRKAPLGEPSSRPNPNTTVDGNDDHVSVINREDSRIPALMEPETAPRNVQVRPLSSSTLVIQWDEPETPNGQVTGYKVYYTTDSNQGIHSWLSQTVDNNQLTTISDLTPHTIYTIRVQALTSIGPSSLSSPVQVKTQQGVPDQPNMLRATDIGETSVALQWSKPAYGGEYIISYELYWNDTYAKETNHRRIPIAETYTLTGLYPNRLYYIWLAARSQRGEGAPTSPYAVHTKQYDSVKPIIDKSKTKTEDLQINPDTYNRTSITLSCEADGQPKPKITWWKGNNELRNETNKYQVSSDNFTLDIMTRNPRETDVGEYKCVAENRVGKAEEIYEVTIIENDDCKRGKESLLIQKQILRTAEAQERAAIAQEKAAKRFELFIEKMDKRFFP